MDWIVFGDDWGVHPSTEQHIVLNFPSEDKVIWIDSIGMRSPKFNFTDMRRLYTKGKALLRKSEAEEALYTGSLGGFRRIKPKVIPWHKNAAAVRLNTYLLSKTIRRAMHELDIERPVLLSSTPVVVKYLSTIPFSNVYYLRQDEYEKYPGCDPWLVKETESKMYDVASRIFVTANSLFPGGVLDEKTHYLPHGVQLEHFGQVALKPSVKKVLGFFGTIDERMDFELVKAVAESAPDWELEFIGDVLYVPPWLDSIVNVHFRPMVSFRELPACLSGWAAAWTPYVVNEVTKGIHPLKVREYLAAGFASHCTPLPEAKYLNDKVMISSNAEEITQWLSGILKNDNEETRQLRRDSVQGDDWSERAKDVREIIFSVEKQVHVI